MLFDAGYSVVLFDLSGHGESDGTVQGFGYSEGQDAARILAYTRQRFPGQKIGALGSSLGAASFVFATPKAEADVYVLEQLYATLRGLAHAVPCLAPLAGRYPTGTDASAPRLRG